MSGMQISHFCIPPFLFLSIFFYNQFHSVFFSASLFLLTPIQKTK